MVAQTEKRLALVIGNANYDKDELKNPVNDALLIAKTLKKLGFDVILDTNIVSKREFVKRVSEFGERRSNYNVGFVYYAGHGVQVNNENYLLPTKEDFNSEYDVQDYAVSVQKIMRYLTSSTSEVNVLILDACRNNPFESNWNESTRSLGKSGSGLAKMPPPTGSLIAFSTDAGNVAIDGEGKYSIYCESLSKNMLLPNTSLDQIFRNVRADVIKATGGNQKPIEASQLTGDAFYLITKKDYNKIEVKSLKKRADEACKEGNKKEALENYKILEIYLKANLDKFDKSFLREVYVNMGGIYLELQSSDEIKANKYYEEQKKIDMWDENAYRTYIQIIYKSLNNAANSFLNARNLFDEQNLDDKKLKEDYSEVCYKYLRSQSYLDYEAGRIDDDLFIKEIKKLNKFNSENFGNKDYRTACSYYLTGIFSKDSDPLNSYQNLVKSSQILSKSKYNKDEILDYSMTLNLVYPYKWSIMAFNSLLKDAFGDDNFIDKNKAKEVASFLKLNIHNNVDSLYTIHYKIIEDGINISKSNNNQDMEGMLLASVEFAHTFPIIFNATGDIDYETYKKCALSAIKYRRNILKFSDDYTDHIRMLHNNVITYRNLYYVTDTNEIDALKKMREVIYDLNAKSIKLSYEKNNISYFLYSINQYLQQYYYNIDFYSYTDLQDKLNKVDLLFGDIIQLYRKEDKPGQLGQYIEWMDMLFNEKMLQENEINNYNKLKDIYSLLFSEEE